MQRTVSCSSLSKSFFSPSPDVLHLCFPPSRFRSHAEQELPDTAVSAPLFTWCARKALSVECRAFRPSLSLTYNAPKMSSNRPTNQLVQMSLFFTLRAALIWTMGGSGGGDPSSFSCTSTTWASATPQTCIQLQPAWIRTNRAGVKGRVSCPNRTFWFSAAWSLSWFHKEMFHKCV